MPDPDTLFGIPVPTYDPVGVLPFDPDFAYHRGRKWETKVHNFSPLINQRFMLVSNPLIRFQIGYDAMRGTFDFQDEHSKFRLLWDFFNDHKGRMVPFYFFDPEIWQRYPDSGEAHKAYRTNPPDRMNHPTDSTIGRYIVNFDEDQMETELFEWKLLKSKLILVGYPG